MVPSSTVLARERINAALSASASAPSTRHALALGSCITVNAFRQSAALRKRFVIEAAAGAECTRRRLGYVVPGGTAALKSGVATRTPSPSPGLGKARLRLF